MNSKSFTRKFSYDGNEILNELDGDNNVLSTFTHSELRTDDVTNKYPNFDSVDTNENPIQLNECEVEGM